jgi:hypothetical protein|tara:strand:+ start:546 stop:878 length:333 start_codon:yes stop_codon:yes gene_type:complete
MASQQTNEVEEMLNDLRKQPGFVSFMILNNDGVVIKWGQEEGSMPYEDAVHCSHHILSLYQKSRACISTLFSAEEESQIECIRLRTDGYELIAAQQGKFTLVATQQGAKI